MNLVSKKRTLLPSTIVVAALALGCGSLAALWAQAKGRRGMARAISTSRMTTASRAAMRRGKSTFFAILQTEPTVCCSTSKAGL